jgi:hypothetical protein
VRDGQPGPTLAAFLASLRPLLPPLPPTPPPGDAALARLAQTADLIVVARLGEGGGAGGKVYYRAAIERWLKKPAGLHADNIGVVIENCLLSRVRLGSGRFVFFLQGGVTDRGGAEGWPLDGTAGIYGIREDAIEFGGLPAYWGWSLDRFLVAVRAGLR